MILEGTESESNWLYPNIYTDTIETSWSFVAMILVNYCVKYCDWVYSSASVLSWSLAVEIVHYNQQKWFQSPNAYQ